MTQESSHPSTNEFGVRWRVIKAGVPDRWQSFVEPLAFERSPQILIDTMLKATTKVRDKALQQMRNKLNSIINGPFWTAANLARDMVRVDRLGLRQSMRQWIMDDLDLLTIKARMIEMPRLTEVRKNAINTFDADYATMCHRLNEPDEQVPSSNQPHCVDKSTHWDGNEKTNTTTKKTCLASRKTRGKPLFPTRTTTKTTTATKVGKKRKYHWGKGENEPNYKRNNNLSWRRKGGKGGKSGKANNYQNRQARLELPCTWHTCQGKPTHSRRECPEWAKKQCSRAYCHMADQPHLDHQCRMGAKEQANAAQTEAQNQQRRYDNTNNVNKQRRNRFQLNYFGGNRMLAQQMEENYQRMQNQQPGASQEPQVQLASSNQLH